MGHVLSQSLQQEPTCHTLISNVYSPELGDNAFIFLKGIQLVLPYYGSPRKLIQAIMLTCWYSLVFFPTLVGTGPWAQGQPGL